jgi:hypothetical protein
MLGVKKIEYRSRLTKIRERIYIYAAQGRYTPENEADMMAFYGIEDVDCDDLPRGVVIGTVELFDCTEGDDGYEWHLRKPERAKRLRKPTGRPQPGWFNPF